MVYPEGTRRFWGKLLTWNAGHCCGYAMQQKTDDVGFISALLDKLLQDYAVDSRRIFVTGMSNGGMMAHRLGIELSDRIAAIAPVVATIFGDQTLPAHPVSALMINGLLDQSVPNQGGPPGGRFSNAWDGTLAQPSLSQGTFWASVNDCSAAPVYDDTGAYGEIALLRPLRERSRRSLRWPSPRRGRTRWRSGRARGQFRPSSSTTGVSGRRPDGTTPDRPTRPARRADRPRGLRW